MSGTWQTKAMVLSTYFRNALLSAAAARPAGPLWPTPVIKLSQDPAFSPQPADTDATLSAGVANFSGYAAAVPVFTVPVNLSPQTQALITSVIFEATAASPFVPNSITGYWGSDGTNVTGAEAFGAGNSISIAAAGDYVWLDYVLPLGAVQDAA